MSNTPRRLSRAPVKNTRTPRDPNAPMTKVEKMAIVNRYVFPVVSVLGPLLVAWLMKADILIPLGVGCYIFSTYQLVGYKQRWDHIYCSIQLYKKERMTPDVIDWNRFTAFDATALPIAFLLLGTFALLFGTNGT